MLSFVSGTWPMPSEISLDPTNSGSDAIMLRNTMEAINQALALAGPLSYFSLTTALLFVVANSLKPKKLASLPSVAVVYGLFSIASFIHTFSCKWVISICTFD